MTRLPWSWSALLLGWSLGTALGLEVKMDDSDDNRQRCAGMYSQSSWGGSVNPYISVKFLPPVNQPDPDPVASIVIFEWKDESLIGVTDPANPEQKLELCQPLDVPKYCDPDDIGQFILQPNTTQKSGNLVFTQAIHLKSAAPIKYEIKNTGYYCVLTDKFSATQYTAVAEFRNAFGELPASQIPKLPFYGGITILYALIAVFWGFLYYQHRHDILPVQNYITAILLFLVVEMLMTWGFYDYMNRNGANLGSKVLLVLVAVLNAARNSFSFFLLLIVCMGYGVVKHTLGRTMTYVRYLAIAHFVFGLVYAIASLLITPDAAGPFVLLIVLPLASTLTAFYVWTLNSLNATLKDLRERKQHAKEAMYKSLWWCIILSIFVIFGFFFFNSFSFASASDADYVPFHWKTRWFVLDGWLNLVYFADVAFIAYVWRPTANNRRFAMSDEIAQDDDGGFEIADIGAPGDSDDSDDDGDEEAQIGKPPPRGAGQTQGVTGGAPPAASAAPRSPQPPVRNIPRDSLDGETIFAVGEDGDKFSEDEDSDEDAKLVRSKK